MQPDDLTMRMIHGEEIKLLIKIDSWCERNQGKFLGLQVGDHNV